MESSDDAIISKDLEGIVATWNKGAERIFGYAAEEIIVSRRKRKAKVLTRRIRAIRTDANK